MASLPIILLHRHYSWFVFSQFIHIEKTFKSNDIRRHDELIGPNDVIEAVSVSYFNE